MTKVYLVITGEKYEGSSIKCITLNLAKAKIVFTKLKKELRKSWPEKKERTFPKRDNEIALVERACDYVMIKEMELE
jgi:hypothetical protein